MSDKELIIKLTILKKRILRSNLNTIEKRDYTLALDETIRKFSEKKNCFWRKLFDNMIILAIWIIINLILWGVLGGR